MTTTDQHPSPPPDDTALLLTYLQTHDAPCPLCKYNLRNLVVPRCPECGRQLELTVGITEPFMLPWTLTTVFVAMAAGIGIIFIVGSMAHGLPGWHDIPAFPCMAMFYSLLAIPLTAFLIAARRKFMKLPIAAQYGLATAAFAVNGFLLLGTLATA